MTKEQLQEYFQIEADLIACKQKHRDLLAARKDACKRMNLVHHNVYKIDGELYRATIGGKAGGLRLYKIEVTEL